MPLAPPLAVPADSAPAARDWSSSAPAGRLWLEEGRFEPLYTEIAPRLRGYLARITGSPAAADDLTQESFLRFLTRPLRAGNEAQWHSYLFQIATNLARDRWRLERREAGFLERLTTPGGQATPIEAKLTARVDVAAVFARLSARDRALLWLAYVEGYEHAEIAPILGLRATSVRVLLFRLRRKAAVLFPAPSLTSGGMT